MAEEKRTDHYVTLQELSLALSREDYSRAVDEEVQDLEYTINSMLDRIEQLEKCVEKMKWVIELDAEAPKK